MPSSHLLQHAHPHAHTHPLWRQGCLSLHSGATLTNGDAAAQNLLVQRVRQLLIHFVRPIALQGAKRQVETDAH